MFIFLFILLNIFTNENNLQNDYSYIKKYLPDNLNKKEDIKSFTKKALKKAFLVNTYKDDEYSSNNIYSLDAFFDTQIKINTSILYETLKINLNTSLANVNMSYIALDNTFNFKIYKNINKDLQISLSEEKKINSYEQVLFNFIYNF